MLMGQKPSDWILKCVFNDTKCSLIEIWRSLNDMDYVNNPILDIQSKCIYFRINIDSVTKAFSHHKIFAPDKDKENEFDVSQIHTIIELGIAPLSVRGIRGITNATIHPITTQYRDTVLGSMSSQKKFVIHASGSQLQDVLANPAVDYYTYTFQQCS